MDSHPMRVRPAAVAPAMMAWKPAMAVLLIVSFLTGTGGAVFAAQDALPGEALYPVKLASEEVRIRLSLSSESRVRFAARRAERRLTEAEAIMSSRLEVAGERESPKEAEEIRLEATMARFEKHLEAFGKGEDDVMAPFVDRILKKHEALTTASASETEAFIRPARAALELELRFHEERREQIMKRMEKLDRMRERHEDRFERERDRARDEKEERDEDGDDEDEREDRRERERPAPTVSASGALELDIRF